MIFDHITGVQFSLALPIKEKSMINISLNGKSFSFQNIKNLKTVGKQVFINGDNVMTCEGQQLNVVVDGNIEKIDAGGSVTINGDVGSSIDCGGSCSVVGDVDGDIDCGGSCKVVGSHKGDIDAGGSVNIRS